MKDSIDIKERKFTVIESVDFFLILYQQKMNQKIYGILNVLDKISFSRFLLLVQRCIEVDSEEMLKEYYKKPILKRNLTMNFLNSLSLININKKYVLKIMEDFEIYL